MSSACAIYSAPSLAGRPQRICPLAASGSSAAKLVLGTRLGLVVLLPILVDVFVLSFRLHLLGVGFALALVAEGGVVIRHVRCHAPLTSDFSPSLLSPDHCRTIGRVTGSTLEMRDETNLDLQRRDLGHRQVSQMIPEHGESRMGS